ncbi:5-formyltetrahydrofolate cyclo-ligase [Arthrobacter crystallopoietes BAB-32]|uniref:5-formyltetrahydrofolate cyclo-ligase n=1 Tax=Arthrobacter crystallopoietes BAB-32 TaxID=1246476 RepID=N1V620_9MICC|nr:5-formyltetrahydrofolate cyclo-ligase [Arthrobacter crystallopoietes]EMY35459.1 5-formyltetrahydrofolate cyclo-ligase [Arthrobacter crystallopoietes BAB-32]
MTTMDKETARNHFRSMRRDMTDAERREAAQQLCSVVMAGLEPLGLLPGQIVAAYLSTGPEPSTDLLLPALEKAGYKILVPVCEPGYQLSWTRWYDGVELARSPRAWVYEPVGERLPLQVMTDVALLLIPGLSVDTDGNRMGQGGGYYDRFLAAMDTLPSKPRQAGVFYAHEVVPSGTFEVTNLDAPLEGAVSPEGWTWFDSRTV